MVTSLSCSIPTRSFALINLHLVYNWRTAPVIKHAARSQRPVTLLSVSHHNATTQQRAAQRDTNKEMATLFLLSLCVYVQLHAFPTQEAALVAYIRFSYLTEMHKLMSARPTHNKRQKDFLCWRGAVLALRPLQAACCPNCTRSNTNTDVEEIDISLCSFVVATKKKSYPSSRWQAAPQLAMSATILSRRPNPVILSVSSAPAH